MRRNVIRIESVLFDFDGVLFDTSKMIARAWRLAASEWGRVITDTQLQRDIIGVEGAESRRRLFGDLTPEERKRIADTIERYEEAESCMPVHGAFEFLEKVQNAGVSCALVTGSWDRKIDNILESHKIKDPFDFRVTRDSVRRGKPAPDPYRLAMKKIRNVMATSPYIVAIEDSISGVVSARAANCTCIGLDFAKSKRRAELLQHGANVCVPGFQAMTVRQTNDSFSEIVFSL